MAEKICPKNKQTPKSVLLNIKDPTLDIKNIGEEVEQNAHALTLSLCDKAPQFLRSQTTFAPIG